MVVGCGVKAGALEVSRRPGLATTTGTPSDTFFIRELSLNRAWSCFMATDRSGDCDNLL